MRATSFIRRAALCVAIAMPTALYAQDAATPAASASAARPKVKRVKGLAVDVKCGDEWKKATFQNVAEPEWSLVLYEDNTTYEWVEPWRMRPAGSDFDMPTAPQNPPATLDNKGIRARPPRVRPGPAPFAATEESAALPIEWPVTAVDATKVPETTPAASAKWAYVPAEIAPTKLRDAPIPLGGGVQTDGSDAVVALDVSGPIAFVAYQSKSVPKFCVAETFDIAAMKPVARAELHPATRPLAASPDGKRIFCRAEGAHEGTRNRIDVWDLEGGPRATAKHVVSFEPYPKENAKDVEHAFAIDADRIVTVNRDGSLIAWKIAAGSATPIWRTRLIDGDVALSQDRRVLAGIGKTALVLINVDDGKVAGSIETLVRAIDAMSFRGDGKRLAVLAGPTICEFDLEAGKQSASIGISLLTPTDIRHLAGDVVLAIGGLKSTAVDVGRGALAAQYTTTGIDQTAVAGDRLVGITRRGNKRELSSWAIAPTGGVVPPTVANAASVRASVEVQLDVDEYAKRAIVDAMRKQMTARGWTIVEPNEPASVRVVAKTEMGASESRSFVSSIGKRESHTVTPTMSVLTIAVEGQEAWKTQSPGPQIPIAVGPAEQMRPAIEAAARQPNVAFLKNAVLPTTLFQPMNLVPTGVPQQSLSAGVAARN